MVRVKQRLDKLEQKVNPDLRRDWCEAVDAGDGTETIILRWQKDGVIHERRVYGVKFLDV